MIFETVAVWENEFFAHEALTLQDAQEWAQQYAHNKGCKVRVWAVVR